MTGFRGVLPIATTPGTDDESKGIAESRGWFHSAIRNTGAREVRFVVGELRIGISVGIPTLRQHHGAPGEHSVDCRGSLQPSDSAKQQGFNPAFALENT